MRSSQFAVKSNTYRYIYSNAALLLSMCVLAVISSDFHSLGVPHVATNPLMLALE